MTARKAGAQEGGGDDAKRPELVNLTRHPDNDTSPRLSADGKVLVFLSERAGDNEEYDVWQVFLDKRLEGLKPYELDEYFKKAAEASAKRRPLGTPTAAKTEPGAAKTPENGKPADKPAEPEKKADVPAEPMTFDADDAYLRVRRITTLPGSESDLALTPGGDRIVFSASADGERSLFSTDRKSEDRKVLQAGAVSSVGVSLTGEKVSFVRAGTAASVPSKGGKLENIGIDAPVTIEVAQQQRQKFLEAARILGTRFYHPTLKGLNWSGLTDRYLTLAMKIRTTEEFNRVVEMLFGELEGSHVGISGGEKAFTAPRPAIGYLGADVTPVEDGYRVTGVLRGSPADQKTSQLEVGDTIIGIDGAPARAPAPAGAPRPPLPDLAAALAGKAGKESLLELDRADKAKPRYVLIVSASSVELNNVAYQDTLRRRRELVDRLSDGKLGYLHIRGMSEPSVRDFERDLYAAAHTRQGLIIDVRDNGGGSTADILLSSLTAPVHAYTIPRGADPAAVPHDAYPRDRRLIYAYTRPINVLVNENSFSNAEIFAHAIQTIHRGTLVGTTTFGGVISTGAASLIDGTTVRTPGRGWHLPDGTDMESHGAQPEVAVDQTPQDESSGKDAQLEAAVKELLGRVGK